MNYSINFGINYTDHCMMNYKRRSVIGIETFAHFLKNPRKLTNLAKSLNASLAVVFARLLFQYGVGLERSRVRDD